MDDEFGRAHGRTLTRDHVLFELGNRTAEQALADGEQLRTVWLALCDGAGRPAGAPLGPRASDARAAEPRGRSRAASGRTAKTGAATVGARQSVTCAGWLRGR